MAAKDIPGKIAELALPVANELGLELVDVEFVREGQHWYLRVFLDKEGGIDIDDCAAVSEKLSRLLDDHDPVDRAYMLEVSSPGLDRPLKKPQDFARYSGRLVRVKTFAPLHGQKETVGRLVGLEGEEVVFTVGTDNLRVPLEKVASIRLEIEF